MKHRRVFVQRSILSCLICILMFSVYSDASFAELSPWDCPNCGRTGNTGHYCEDCSYPVLWNQKSEGYKSFLNFVPMTISEMSVQTEVIVQASKLWDDDTAPQTTDQVIPKYLIDLVNDISSNPPEIIKKGSRYKVRFPYQADRIQDSLPSDADNYYQMTCNYFITESTTAGFELSEEGKNTLSFMIPDGIDIQKIDSLVLVYHFNNTEINNLWVPELSLQFVVSEGNPTGEMQIILSLNKGTSSFIWTSYINDQENTCLLTIDVPGQSWDLRLYYESGALIDWW